MKRLTQAEMVARIRVAHMQAPLSPQQVRDLALAHVVTVDAIAGPSPTLQDAWDLAEAALTWSIVAEALRKRDPGSADLAAASAAMEMQSEVAVAVIARYHRTGRVGFTGPELSQARAGLAWMDALAEAVDGRTAALCAMECRRRINVMRAERREAVAA